MSNTYKGYELAEAVDNGLFSVEQRVNGAGYFNCTIGFILKDVGNNFLFNNFEIIEEQEEIDKLEIDENGFIHTNNGTWKGRKLDVAFAEVINKLADEVKNIKEK